MNIAGGCAGRVPVSNRSPRRSRLKVMRLLLIRHGQTPDNVEGKIGTVIPGPPLTELGLRQAAAIPEALAGEHIEAIYASTLTRAQLTAQPLAQALGLEVQVIEGVQEIGGGDLEGKSDDGSIRTYMGTIFSWWQDFGARIPGSENGHEFNDRFTAAVNGIAAEHDGTVVLISHGAAIRTWASWTSENVDAAFSRVHDLPNTAMVIVEGTPDSGWVTTHWNGEPVGGASLEDPTAADPTGEAD
jgi:broad specificity phosphatase PhoE